MSRRRPWATWLAVGGAALVATVTAADAGTVRTFTATAYALPGRTATGSRARPGVVAADPAVLPLGSRIRIEHAGAYSGEYVVEDTGGAVRGHRIDIFLASDAEARRFGRRAVRVEVLDGSVPSAGPTRR